MTAARRILAALVLLAALLPQAVSAQAGGGLWWVVGGLAADTPAQAQGDGPDYAAWEALARRAEAATADPTTPEASLQTLRLRVAEARDQFQAAQGANASRIATLRQQIAALGATPAEGETEPPEIAQRRSALGAQLAELSAPGIAAGEALSRAEGIIRQIDAILRERQANALLQLLPSPLNPATWGEGWNAVERALAAIGRETATNWASEARRDRLRDNLPGVIGLLVVALVLLARGRRWMERLTLVLQDRAASHRGREIWALLASFGQVALPIVGALALVQALRTTGIAGPTGVQALAGLTWAFLVLFLARWMGGRMFPAVDTAYSPLTLAPERRREGRFHAGMLGLVLFAEALLHTMLPAGGLSDAARSATAFPLIALAGLLLFRIGQLMRRHFLTAAAAPGGPGYYDRLINLGGRAAMVVGIGGGALAAVGYVPAAEAAVFPAIYSLALAGLLVVLQRLIAEIHATIVRQEGDAGDGLIPVLVSFTLTLLSLPLFALIWGVRDSELWELYARFREGIALGDTRISPANFLTFAIVFGIGYTLTRMVQGALGGTVLPKTKLEKGAQKSLVSGMGYVGVFLAALAAFSAAGIDLSSLAIVAGALSVGIGFGLQNIVSNFVSGIILLIERPVSEGDWIDVGGQQGTVKSISVRSTVIQAFDRSEVIVPNADLITGRVTNFTRQNLTGRLIVPIGVDYGSDTRKVQKVLQEIADAQPLAMLDPPPAVFFMGFGTDALNFEIRIILRDVNMRLRVQSEINHEIARRFRAEGIDMPFAQRDIWLRNPEVLREVFAPATPGKGEEEKP